MRPVSVPTDVSQKELAAAIKRTPRQVYNLTQEEVFTKNEAGRYPWPESLHAWIDHRLAVQKRETESTGLWEAELRDAIASASLKEIKLEEARAGVVTNESHRKEMTRMLSAVVQVLDTFPVKHAHRLPGEAPLPERVAALRRISREIREELRRAGHSIEDAETLASYVPKLRQLTTQLALDPAMAEAREMLFELANRIEGASDALPSE